MASPHPHSSPRRERLRLRLGAGPYACLQLCPQSRDQGRRQYLCGSLHINMPDFFELLSCNPCFRWRLRNVTAKWELETESSGTGCYSWLAVAAGPVCNVGLDRHTGRRRRRVGQHAAIAMRADQASIACSHSDLPKIATTFLIASHFRAHSASECSVRNFRQGLLDPFRNSIICCW